MYKTVLKRMGDLAGAWIALIVLSPVMLACAYLIRRKLGSPVLFRQKRAGLNDAPFEVIKFRTMTDAVGPDGAPRSDAERLTPFGKRLRALSLDELPGLFNVLRGEMSLVGPRPLLYDYVRVYTPEQRRRHEVRPGITGWAQVNGRNSITWEAKFALDTWYVDHCSWVLDLKILTMTLIKAFRRDGINADGEATMGRFDA